MVYLPRAWAAGGVVTGDKQWAVYPTHVGPPALGQRSAV